MKDRRRLDRTARALIYGAALGLVAWVFITAAAVGLWALGGVVLRWLTSG